MVAPDTSAAAGMSATAADRETAHRDRPAAPAGCSRAYRGRHRGAGRRTHAAAGARADRRGGAGTPRRRTRGELGSEAGRRRVVHASRPPDSPGARERAASVGGSVSTRSEKGADDAVLHVVEPGDVERRRRSPRAGRRRERHGDRRVAGAPLAQHDRAGREVTEALATRAERASNGGDRRRTAAGRSRRSRASSGRRRGGSGPARPRRDDTEAERRLPDRLAVPRRLAARPDSRGRSGTARRSRASRRSTSGRSPLPDENTPTATLSSSSKPSCTKKSSTSPSARDGTPAVSNSRRTASGVTIPTGAGCATARSHGTGPDRWRR